MLVVDVHALRTVHTLHFVEQVHLRCLDAEDTQNLARVLGTFGQLIARDDMLPFFDAQTRRGGQIMFRLFAHVAVNRNFALLDHCSTSVGCDDLAIGPFGNHFTLADLIAIGDHGLGAARQ